jgi:hypothetical protein
MRWLTPIRRYEMAGFARARYEGGGAVAGAGWHPSRCRTTRRMPPASVRGPFSTVIRSELVYLLVRLDREYTDQHPAKPREEYYAGRIFEHFGAR